MSKIDIQLLPHILRYNDYGLSFIQIGTSKYSLFIHLSM